jgi:hypothetical protein
MCMVGNPQSALHNKSAIRNPQSTINPQSAIRDPQCQRAGFDRYTLDAASSLIGVTLSGSILTIR